MNPFNLLLLFLVTFISILQLLNCTPNTSLAQKFELIHPSLKEPLNVDEGEITLYNYGAKTGKSIFKFYHRISSLDDFYSLHEKLNLIAGEHNCSVSLESFQCLFFGNQIINLVLREYRPERNFASYSLTMKVEEASHEIFLNFKITNNVEEFDKDMLGMSLSSHKSQNDNSKLFFNNK